MNQGFAQASINDWLLFWGSDDWAAGPNVLAKAIAALQSTPHLPDLIVFRGRYADASSDVLGRRTAFHSAGLLGSDAYRRALFLGSTPPHQATFIGPGARRRLASYTPGFRLSADLDYFLQLSRSPDLRVQCLDLELVHMADSGVSGQQTQRRLQEVYLAYCRRFGMVSLFAFSARYLRRLACLLVRF